MAATGAIRSACPYCGVGCGIVMQVENGTVTGVSGDRQHPANGGRLCSKGGGSHLPLTDGGRMDSGWLRDSRQYDPVKHPMDATIAAAARRLRELLDRHGPQAVALYVSGQMSLEAQYLANKLVKGYFGSNQIESNSRLCMASAGSGYKLSLGSDGPPGSYDDFERADLFFVTGANMADCHPILFLRMMDRVKQGAKLIVVDPRRSATADKADLYLPVRPGSDLALLNGILHLLVKNGHTDANFIAEFTEGWQAMPDFLNDYTPERVAALTGLAVADIERAARWIGEAGEWVSCWTMGLNQSTHGTWNTNAICNLHLATGKICRPGSGPFSLTGQPNAMGGREMGYMGPGLPGQRSALVAADRAFVEDIWQLPPGTLRSEAGGGTIEMFQQMQAGAIKACWIICTNPVASVANRSTVIAGLQAAELVIVQDAFLDTETSRYADILLPAALHAEADGVMINSERTLTLCSQATEPPGEALPDWQIIARIACEMGYASAFSYRSAEQIFDEIRRFHNPATGYDLRGASYARLRQQPLQWPCPPDDDADRHPLRYINDGRSQTQYIREDGTVPRLAFATASGRARFFARPHQEPAEMADADYPFCLNTGRVQHQWHTLTKTGKVAKLNRLNPGPFIEVNPQDAQRLALKEGDLLEIRSRRGMAILPSVVTDRVAPGSCFVPFHWNDVYGDALAINAVTSDATDALSQQPEFKQCAVSLRRVEQLEVRTSAEAEAVMQPASASAADFPAQQALSPSKVALFASLAGVKSVAAPQLSDREHTWMAGFISGLAGDVRPGLPRLPDHAPLGPETRLWLDGMLSGLFSRTEAAAPPLCVTSPVIAETAAALAPAVTLLWASQTGNTDALAQQVNTALCEAGFNVDMRSMDRCLPSQLPPDAPLLLLTSTFGDGDPPDNGQGFWRALQCHETSFATLRYAVLALGDSSFARFCQHGRQLDERFSALGATALLPRRECDTDYDADVQRWLDEVLPLLGASVSTAAAPSAAFVPQAVPPAAFSSSDTPASVAITDSGYSKSRPYLSRLVSNRLLNGSGSQKETRAIVLRLDASMRYRAGDALGVWPQNCPQLVAELLERVQLAAEERVTVDGYGEIGLAEALTHHYEIARPLPKMLALIAAGSGNEALRQRLTDEAALRDWLWGRQLVDVLSDFPLKMSAAGLLAGLKRLQPRLYSLSSSPLAHPGEVHLTLSAVRYGRRKGVASCFLADRAAGVEVPIFIQPSQHFHLPDRGDTPVVMIGPGTGIAPFRGFLHERRVRGDAGQNWLFFGEQHAETDFYYREELEAMQRSGLLTRLSLAFSRDQAEKIYVQDRIRQQGPELWQWLQQGAVVYLCGDAGRMAKDVDRALCEVAAEHGGIAVERAGEWLQQLAADRRYLRDVY